MAPLGPFASRAAFPNRDSTSSSSSSSDSSSSSSSSSDELSSVAAAVLSEKYAANQGSAHLAQRLLERSFSGGGQRKGSLPDYYKARSGAADPANIWPIIPANVSKRGNLDRKKDRGQKQQQQQLSSLESVLPMMMRGVNQMSNCSSTGSSSKRRSSLAMGTPLVDAPLGFRDSPSPLAMAETREELQQPKSVGSSIFSIDGSFRRTGSLNLYPEPESSTPVLSLRQHPQQQQQHQQRHNPHHHHPEELSTNFNCEPFQTSSAGFNRVDRGHGPLPPLPSTSEGFQLLPLNGSHRNAKPMRRRGYESDNSAAYFADEDDEDQLNNNNNSNNKEIRNLQKLAENSSIVEQNSDEEVVEESTSRFPQSTYRHQQKSDNIEQNTTSSSVASLTLTDNNPSTITAAPGNNNGSVTLTMDDEEVYGDDDDGALMMTDDAELTELHDCSLLFTAEETEDNTNSKIRQPTDFDADFLGGRRTGVAMLSDDEDDDDDDQEDDGESGDQLSSSSADLHLQGYRLHENNSNTNTTTTDGGGNGGASEFVYDSDATSLRNSGLFDLNAPENGNGGDQQPDSLISSIGQFNEQISRMINGHHHHNGGQQYLFADDSLESAALVGTNGGLSTGPQSFESFDSNMNLPLEQLPLQKSLSDANSGGLNGSTSLYLKQSDFNTNDQRNNNTTATAAIITARQVNGESDL